MALFDGILVYLKQGGFVMWPLAVGTLLLWYALGYRFLTLRRGSTRSLESLLAEYARHPQGAAWGLVDQAAKTGVSVLRTPSMAPLRERLEQVFLAFVQEAGRYGLLVQVIVVVAPLAGLLGTVTGMIETFDALGDMSMHSQSGGIAGGISQALLTTQMGLAVAIPGLIVGQLLRQKQSRLTHEIELLKELLVDRQAQEPASSFSQDAKALQCAALLPEAVQEDVGRGFRRRERSAVMTAIDISPLIDMVFILLIFFMVSTTFIKDMQVSLSRPAQNSTPSRSQTKAIRIVIEQSGALSMEGSSVKGWMLQSRLRELLKENAERPVLVVTHRFARTERLVEVIDQCRLAGAKDVGVAKPSEAG